MWRHPADAGALRYDRAVKADRTRWEARYRGGDCPHDGPPSTLLHRWLPSLTRRRRAARGGSLAPVDTRAPHARGAPRALDVATGLGRNALALAHAGYRVDAVDISPTALHEAARRARRAGLPGIRWIVADLDRWRPQRGLYDVVVNAFFLKRRMFPALRAAVRPGGLLIFETHLDAGEHDAGPADRSRRLRPGELRRILGDWEILYASDGLYRDRGRRMALGRIVARRPVRRLARTAGAARSVRPPRRSTGLPGLAHRK